MQPRIEYVYHTVTTCDGAIRDLCVNLDYPMMSRAGIDDINRKIHSFIKVVEDKPDISAPVFLATPTLIGYVKDGEPWEPKVEGKIEDLGEYKP